MAEIATIARPYAEALFKAAGTDRAALAEQVQALADVAGQRAAAAVCRQPQGRGAAGLRR